MAVSVNQIRWISTLIMNFIQVYIDDRLLPKTALSDFVDCGLNKIRLQENAK
jgi:hypothetical protein